MYVMFWPHTARLGPASVRPNDKATPSPKNVCVLAVFPYISEVLALAFFFIISSSFALISYFLSSPLTSPTTSPELLSVDCNPEVPLEVPGPPRRSAPFSGQPDAL